MKAIDLFNKIQEVRGEHNMTSRDIIMHMAQWLVKRRFAYSYLRDLTAAPIVEADTHKEETETDIPVLSFPEMETGLTAEAEEEPTPEYTPRKYTRKSK